MANEKFEAMLNDPDFMSLPENEQDSIVQEMRQKDFGTIPKTESFLQRATRNLTQPSTRPLFPIGIGDVATNPIGSIARAGVSAAGIPEENIAPIASGFAGEKVGEMVGRPDLGMAVGTGLGSAVAEANKPLRGENPNWKNPLIQSALSYGGAKAIKGVVKAVPPVFRFGKKVVKNIGEAFRAPKQLKTVRASIPQATSELEAAKMAQSEIPEPYTDESSRGIRIVKQAEKNTLSELEQSKEKILSGYRNKIVSKVPSIKEKLTSFEDNFYRKYGEILDSGTEEAVKKGMKPDDYYNQVISPVLEEVQLRGSQTPAAKRLASKFLSEEGSKEIPQTFEQMKNLKNSLGKFGSGDDITNLFHEKHGEFVGKYSDIVSRANKSYGEIKNAIKFGRKTISPYKSQELTKAADLLMKEASGGLNETESAYLQTIKSGKGEFSGTGDLLDEATKKAASEVDSQISEIQNKINSIKSQGSQDVSTLKQASSEAKYTHKLEQASRKQGLQQNVLSRSKKLSDLKNLEKDLEAKVKIRNRILLGAGVATLAATRAGRFIPLARETELVSR